MISRKLIENMFNDMKHKYRWHVDGPLVWEYFFLAPVKRHLEQLSEELSSDGYAVVDMLPAGGDSKEGTSKWCLHVQRVETHTVDSLVERNNELTARAEGVGSIVYDGMQAGPIKAN